MLYSLKLYTMFPFRITYQLTTREFLRLSFITRYKHFSAYAITAGGLFFVLFGIYSSRGFDVFIGALIIGLPAINILIRTLIIFRQFPYLQKPVTYTFTADDVLMDRKGIEIRIPWNEFQHIKTAGGFITIHLSWREGIILPVNAFEPQQLELVHVKVSHSTPLRTTL